MLQKYATIKYVTPEMAQFLSIGSFLREATCVFIDIKRVIGWAVPVALFVFISRWELNQQACTK